MLFKNRQIFIVFIFLGMFFSCKKNEKTINQMKPYTGPVAQVTNVEMLFSDSGQIKVKMKAPKQDEYLNGDRIFPSGILLIFNDKQGNENANLVANYGKYDKTNNVYTAKGNVIITDLKEGKKMKSEEMNWNPTTKKVYTTKFVRIETKEEILTGNGLDADQDFKHYKIVNPAGVFSVNQE
ncbi:MAG: LPS export ABC transporter periplasmic protein LptC [Bacteroidota bacterium]|nr:LPS export ABC transporter periplasmic protein LptC [Bacteroidota bacterium]